MIVFTKLVLEVDFNERVSKVPYKISIEPCYFGICGIQKPKMQFLDIS